LEVYTIFGILPYLLTEIPKHMEDTNLDFLENLLPWSRQLPDICRKKKNKQAK
jgi:transposase